MKPTVSLQAVCLGLLLVGCTSASEHARDVAAGAEARNRLTLGTLQREIRVGMSGEDVVAVLGAPNMVTTDEGRRESWVYDRLATEQAYSSSAEGVNALFLAGASGRTGASRTTQRSLTVIVRFDEARRVRDFSYRSSSF
jgi:outer membrane protein assembly factor BamE (lipoprotein component of BamABCDE complex)